MEIFKTVSDNFDCNDNTIYFIDDGAVMQFYQSLNYDLNFVVNTYNKKRRV